MWIKMQIEDAPPEVAAALEESGREWGSYGTQHVREILQVAIKARANQVHADLDEATPPFLDDITQIAEEIVALSKWDRELSEIDPTSRDQKRGCGTDRVGWSAPYGKAGAN